jgi:hypothetical protein
MLMAAILLAAALVAGSVVGYRRISDGESDPNESAVNGGERTASGAERDPTGDPSAGGAPETGAGAAAAEAADDDEEDLSLLSDEERVERLLDANGGRMRQADIVAETGWSDAKVSQLLSAMADEGRVEKLRLGRENLISLPDDEDGDEGADDGDDR